MHLRLSFKNFEMHAIFDFRIVKTSEIENKGLLCVIASELAGQTKNIVIFGLPFSGKTTLSSAIAKNNQNKIVIDEWADLCQTKMLREQKNIVATHQYLTADRENTEKEIKEFLSKQGLALNDWFVVLIRKH
jgi:Holliday junction resolvasome RuvABC ATP-dependent DNA helicase subunit